MSHVPSLRACMVSSQNQRLKSAILLLCKKMLASPSDFNVCLRVLGKPGFLFWFLIHLADCKLRSMLYRTELVGKISFLFHNLQNHFVNRIFQRKVRLFEISTCCDNMFCRISGRFMHNTRLTERNPRRSLSWTDPAMEGRIL